MNVELEGSSSYEVRAARLRLVSRLVVVALLAVLLAILMLAAQRLAGHAIFGFLIWLPLGAWFVSRGLVHGSGTLLRTCRRRLWAPLQGRHHALDDIWIRIEGDDRGRFRIFANDVFRYLERPLDDLGRRKLATRFPPGGLFQDRRQRWWFGEAALLDYLRESAHRPDSRARRLALWLSREALPPLRRQEELAKD